MDMNSTIKVKKKSFQLPHVFVILLILMTFVTVLAYIVPSGQFVREVDPATGRPLLVPGSFQFMEKTKNIGIMDFFVSIYDGIVAGGIIIASLLICSGVLYVLESTGSFAAGIHSMLSKSHGKEFTMLTIFYTIFTLFGVLGFGPPPCILLLISRSKGSHRWACRSSRGFDLRRAPMGR